MGCDDSFATCSGLDDDAAKMLRVSAPLRAGKDQCTDAQDLKLLDESDDDIDECLDTTEDDDSFVACMVKKGFTSGCADCFMSDVNCQWDKCPECDKCTSDDCPKCDQCLEEKCDDSFATCSGLDDDMAKMLRVSAPLRAGKDQCTGAQDLKLIDESDDDIDECLDTTEDDDGFVACMVKKGFTSGCAGCFMSDVNCQWDKCPVCDTCTSDDCPKCDKCLEDKCDDSFATCSGLDDAANKLRSPSPFFPSRKRGKCMNRSDSAQLDTITTLVDDCYRKVNSEDGFVDCMTHSGLTEGCATCFGEFTSCVMDKCPACAKDNDAKCSECYRAQCGQEMMDCSGLEPRNLALSNALSPFPSTTMGRLLRYE